jgi:hybrid cluster-associated redox disulfide protein
MQKRSKSAIKWLVVFGIILLLLVMFAGTTARFHLESKRAPDSSSIKAGESEKQLTVNYRWDLPTLWGHVFTALLLTLAIWLCSVIYRNSKHAKELRRSCDNLSSTFMRHEQEFLKELGELKASVASLKFESLKRGGKFRFTKDMPLTEALAVHPDVARVLFTRGFACVSCPSAANETLEQAAQVHGMDVQPILDDLNELLKS